MKPVSSIVRRSDGLRILECYFLTTKTREGGKVRVAESRLKRLLPQGASCPSVKQPLSEHAKHMQETWCLLAKATLSRRTYKLLFILCANTTSAPTRVAQPVPVLSKAATDIRPWLCDPVALADLFFQLRAFDVDKSYGQKLCDPDEPGVVYDPWFVFRTGEYIPLGEADIASIFWERAASFLQDVTYAELKEIEAAYFACLDEKGASQLAEMIIGHTQGETAANWINLFMRVPIEARCKQVEHWITDHFEVKHCPRDLVYLARPASMVEPKNYSGLCYLWDGLAANADTSQLLDGIMLWNKYGWRRAPGVYAGGSVDTQTLVRLTNLLSVREDHHWVACQIWKSMHENPVLVESFRALLDEPHGHRGWLLRLMREVQYGERDDALAREFNRDFKEVSRLLLSVPKDYREKAVEYFEYAYWDRTVELPAVVLMKHIASLCVPPFTASHDNQSLWCKLVADWQAHELPLSSWKRIDSASRSNNQAGAIENGLDRLDKKFFQPVLRSGLKLRVRLSLEIVRLTRQAMITDVDRALSKLREHPMLDVSLNELVDLETYTHLVGVSKELLKWKLHLSGERSLRAESAEQIFDKLEGRRVETILNYFKEELVPPTESADGLQLHTRLYAGAADANRRSYRKLIQRYCSGGENGVLFHPSNQLWLRTHPYVKKGIWLTGVRMEIQLADGSHVFLELERRFEQVLKMGTLVNSCLALDGCNSHSALANAADVNKQVIMAYDENNKFLGRQLIGIAEQRKLVVFEVYGEESSRLMPAFAAFDFQLGQLMALPVHLEGDYEIKKVVCREWYNDYHWAPPTEDRATIIDRQWGGSQVCF